MYTDSFAVLGERLSRRDWPGVGALISDSIKRVPLGAELVIMPTNATHYATDYFLPQCPVPSAPDLVYHPFTLLASRACCLRCSVSSR
jgi:hypothetical protein